jgi:hypothetical protein
LFGKRGKVATAVYVFGLLGCLWWLFQESKELAAAVLILAGTIGDVRIPARHN